MEIGQRLGLAHVKVPLQMTNQQLDEILPTKMDLGICAQTQVGEVVGSANVSLPRKMSNHHSEHVKGVGLVNVRRNRMSQGVLKRGPRANLANVTVLRGTMNQ